MSLSQKVRHSVIRLLSLIQKQQKNDRDLKLKKDEHLINNGIFNRPSMLILASFESTADVSGTHRTIVGTLYSRT